MEFSDITQEHLRRCKPGRMLNDSVIGFAFEYLDQVVFKRKDILFVNPAGAFVITHENDMEDLRDALDGIGISVEKKLILFPVSDACNLSMSALSGSQGTHWSLLAYDTPRRRFLYFDSSGDYNVSAALKLAKKLSVRLPSGSVSSGSVTSESVTSGSGGDGKIRAPVAGSGTTTVVVKSLPVKIGQVKTPQQSNGFDCGVFVVLFARALATACAESDSKLMDPANVLRGVGTGQAVAQMRSEIPRWAAATVFKKGKGGNSTSNTKSTGKLALPGQQ